jgi:hypothetical protein
VTKAVQGQVRQVQPRARQIPAVEMEQPVRLGPELNRSKPMKTKVALEGTTDVITQEVRPVVGGKTKLPPNSPAEVAASVGIGRASKTPIDVPGNIVLKGVDDVPGGFIRARTDDLLEIAEQLAANKAVVNENLKLLDEMFKTTVDFGRKSIDRVPYSEITPAQVKRIIEAGGKLNLPPKSFRFVDREFRPFIMRGDYEGLAQVGGFSKEGALDIIAEELANANNTTLRYAQRVLPEDQMALRELNFSRKKPFLAKLPTTLYHGTAIADWNPKYNLELFGTRGELGSGLYLIDNPEKAAIYAKAMVNINVSPETLSRKIEPAVYQVRHSLKTPLDARAELRTTSEFVKKIISSLPVPIRNAINQKTTISFASMMDLIEETLVKTKQDTSEQSLRKISDAISDGLRDAGFDSVYDPKSGILMVLDEARVEVVNKNMVEPPKTPMEAIVARYNADAYSAYHFPKRLSVDSNLRDSAAKLLNQLNDAIDTKLQKVQQELLNRGMLPRDTPLPPKEAVVSSKLDKAPITVEEALKNIQNRSSSPCQP